MTVDDETSVALSPRTLGCEAEEIEGLLSFLPAPFAIRRCKATEFQQARFPVMQLHPELGEAPGIPPDRETGVKHGNIGGLAVSIYPCYLRCEIYEFVYFAKLFLDDVNLR